MFGIDCCEVAQICLAPAGNAVKDFSSRKRAVFRSQSRETSEAFHGKCPNSHESSYKNPSRCCPSGESLDVSDSPGADMLSSVGAKRGF